MGEDSGDGEASGALDVTEVRVGGLDEALELVGVALLSGGRVKQISVDAHVL